MELNALDPANSSEIDDVVVTIPRYRSLWYYPLWGTNRHCREHVLSVLQTGLLFREDALIVERALLAEDSTRNRVKPFHYLQRYGAGEALFAAAAMMLCATFVPVTTRKGMLSLLLAASLPLATRARAPPALRACLRSAARITRATHMPRVPETHVSAQRALSMALCRASVALLDAFPWLEPVSAPWESSPEVDCALRSDDSSRIHHLYLVVQSSFLRRAALAHIPPSLPPRDLPRRLRWLHATLMPILLTVYRNAAKTFDPEPHGQVSYKRHGQPMLWKPSSLQEASRDISEIIQIALQQSKNVERNLVTYDKNSQLDANALEKDLIAIKCCLRDCITFVDGVVSQIKPKIDSPVSQTPQDLRSIRVVSEDTPVEIEDQVFFYEKKHDISDTIVGDVPNGPGEKEISAARNVLGELRHRLIEREDAMRARETVALIKTMPELEGNLPYFPRQMRRNCDENEHLKSCDKDDANAEESLIACDTGCKVDASGDNLLVSNDGSVDFDRFKDKCFKHGSSGTDSEDDSENRLLKDVRKERVSRKKNHPPSRKGSLRVKKECELNDFMEVCSQQYRGRSDAEENDLNKFSLGAGLAVASLFRNAANGALGAEETFDAQGEQSSDSGNEE